MFDYIATLFACELLELGELPFKYIARDVSKLGFSFRGILLTEPQAKRIVCLFSDTIKCIIIIADCPCK